MRISDWSSDVCSSDLIAGGLFSVTDVAPTLLDLAGLQQPATFAGHAILPFQGHSLVPVLTGGQAEVRQPTEAVGTELFYRRALRKGDWKAVYLPTSSSAYPRNSVRSEEHTSELQSLMRISSAVFCLQKK